MDPKPYERIDGGGTEPVIRAYGATIGEVFENAAYAVFDVGYHLESVTPTYARPIAAGGESIEHLLLVWLHELIAMSREEGIVPSFFMVDRLEEGGVLGSASGLFAEEVATRGKVVARVLTTQPDFIEIPSGYWVELRFELIAPLTSV